jgi:TctA family transporter
LLDAYATAISGLFQPLPMLALSGGVILGLISGALPGGGLPTLIVLLGFAYYMDPYVALPLAMGAAAVNNTSDTIPAVLLGMPGSATGQASILDGHPLARKGEAGRALAVSYFASLSGGLIGAAGFFVAIMLARTIIRAFGSPEFFMLSLLGIVMVAVVSSGAFLKGLLAASFALALTTIGFDNVTGMTRFTYGTEYLWGGLPLVPVLVGLFAMPEMANIFISSKPIAEQAGVSANKLEFSRVAAVKEVLQHKWLVVRSSLIGLFVGLMPGVGGSAAHWLAYGAAYQTEKGARDTFGTGDIRGVIAPDCANNSIDGGQIVPTLAFGIPGSSHQSIFLAFLLLLGFVPGPNMLNENLDKTILIGLGLVVANVIGTGISLYFTPLLAKIAYIRPGILVPLVTVVLTLAAFQANFSVGDFLTVAVFSGVGALMKVYGWPRPPVIIAIVLGPQLNKYLWLSVQGYGWEMLTRPQSIAVFALAIATIIFTLRVQAGAGKTAANVQSAVAENRAETESATHSSDQQEA